MLSASFCLYGKALTTLQKPEEYIQQNSSRPLDINMVNIYKWKCYHWIGLKTFWAISLFASMISSLLLQRHQKVSICGKGLTLSLIFCQKIENLYNWMDNLWLRVENIVAKGEIARFEKFLLLSLCFQKAVCCRGIRKHLFEGKG